MEVTKQHWIAVQDEEGWAVMARDGEPIARVHPIDHVDVAEMLAHFIAATPDLFEALSEARAQVSEMHGDLVEVGDRGPGAAAAPRRAAFVFVDALGRSARAGQCDYLAALARFDAALSRASNEKGEADGR